MTTAILRVTREKAFNASLAGMNVTVNHQRLGDIRNDETRDFLIHPGRILVEISKGVSKSNSLLIENIQENDIVAVRFKITYTSGWPLWEDIASSVRASKMIEIHDNTSETVSNWETELRKAAKMRDEGLIDREEFKILKRRIIEQS